MSLILINRGSVHFYYMAISSRAKRSSLIGWFSVGILQHGPLPWKRSVPVFFPLPGNSVKLSETQVVLKKRNLFYCC